MFAAPPPKTRTESLLAAAIVAPYAADASQRRHWEAGLERHRHALSRVEKTTDQRQPVTATDASLHRAWERSRAFASDETHRHIGSENRKLMGSLVEIVQKPSAITKMIDAEHRPVIPKRGMEAERRRQKELERENKLLVKRLLSVRSGFNRKSDERDYERHQRNVERMKKISAPAPPRVVRQPRIAAPQPPSQPPLAGGRMEAPRWGSDQQALSSAASTVMEEVVSQAAMRASRSASRTLPPLPRNLAASRSLPALSSSVVDRAPPRAMAATIEASVLLGEEEAKEEADEWIDGGRLAMSSSPLSRGSARSLKALSPAARAQTVQSTSACSSNWPRSARTVATGLGEEDSFSAPGSAPGTPELAAKVVSSLVIQPPHSPSVPSSSPRPSPTAAALLASPSLPRLGEEEGSEEVETKEERARTEEDEEEALEEVLKREEVDTREEKARTEDEDEDEEVVNEDEVSQEALEESSGSEVGDDDGGGPT
mmetsp:Transcript_89981/g.226321  ORF Transcript_89981/g.226321 Transcript_89981/m.226321 type:complete len:486 (+) Transcript_89981:127-1584(+)